MIIKVAKLVEYDSQAAKRGLQFDRIHATGNASTFRVQARMK